MTRTGENMAAVIKGRRGRTQFLTRWESFEDDSWVFGFGGFLFYDYHIQLIEF